MAYTRTMTYAFTYTFAKAGMLVAMARDAKKVLESIWIPQRGDWIVHELQGAIIEEALVVDGTKDNLTVYVSGGRVKYLMNDNTVVWIPKQEACQGILLHDVGHFDNVEILNSFWEWINSERPTSIRENNDYASWLKYFYSIDEMWLAYLMHTKFQKYWDGPNLKWVDEIEIREGSN